MTELQQKLTKILPNLQWQFDFPLKDLTYFKTGGLAEAFYLVKTRQELIEIVKLVRKHQIKLTILGGASNVLVADQGVTGLVLFLAHNQMSLLETAEKVQDQNAKIIRVESGQKMALLVKAMIDWQLTGLEYFLGVPGTVGGAIFNNAHYLNKLIASYIKKVEVIDESGNLKWLNNADCEFAYDSSRFHHTQEVIIQADFLLATGNKAESLKMVQESTVYRAKNQPLGLPSSGCIFKNVENNAMLRKEFSQFKDKALVPTGFLIDQAGLKGTRLGGVEVSTKHAAFIVNTNHGTSADVLNLIKKIKDVVKAKFGVELKEEIFYLS